MFKKRPITKLRRLIRNKRWLENKLRDLLQRSQDLHSFKTWKCDSFFVGFTVAERNLKYFYEQDNRNNRRIEFIEKCLKSNQHIKNQLNGNKQQISS